MDTWSYRAAAAAGPDNVATVSMAVAAAGGPVPPTGLRLAAISGNAVTLESIGTAGPPHRFRLEGGLAPGQVIGAVPTSMALEVSGAIAATLPLGVT